MSTAESKSQAPAAPAAGIPESMFDQATPFPTKPGFAEGSSELPMKPPAMANAQQYTADEMFEMLNRTPLFMTSLDETDGAGGENVELEALRALAYEGTRAEVAGNFREQGNEMAREKRWIDAREYYTKALNALAEKADRSTEDDQAKGDVTWLQNKDESTTEDAEEEERKEKSIEEACLVNRALCNLELKNYRSTNRDCASVLKLNPRNVKAYYRSSQACLALEKLLEAADAVKYCLALDPKNAAALALQQKVAAKQEAVRKQEEQRAARAKRAEDEANAMRTALIARKYLSKTTKERPDVEDAKLTLESPLNPASVMSLPILFLYPTAGQSDFIKSVKETDTIAQHLEYILPCPWDERGEFGQGDGKRVDCFADTVEGGIIKVGKNLLIGEVLSGGKAFLQDGMWRVQIVPRSRVTEWIEEVKRRKT